MWCHCSSGSLVTWLWIPSPSLTAQEDFFPSSAGGSPGIRGRGCLSSDPPPWVYSNVESPCPHKPRFSIILYAWFCSFSNLHLYTQTHTPDTPHSHFPQGTSARHTWSLEPAPSPNYVTMVTKLTCQPFIGSGMQFQGRIINEGKGEVR